MLVLANGELQFQPAESPDDEAIGELVVAIRGESFAISSAEGISMKTTVGSIRLATMRRSWRRVTRLPSVTGARWLLAPTCGAASQASHDQKNGCGERQKIPRGEQPVFRRSAVAATSTEPLDVTAVWHGDIWRSMRVNQDIDLVPWLERSNQRWTTILRHSWRIAVRVRNEVRNEILVRKRLQHLATNTHGTPSKTPLGPATGSHVGQQKHTEQRIAVPCLE